MTYEGALRTCMGITTLIRQVPEYTSQNQFVWNGMNTEHW